MEVVLTSRRRHTNILNRVLAACRREGLNLEKSVEFFVFDRIASGAGTITVNSIKALNTFVVTINRAGLSSKFIAIYPFIGANAACHSLNLVSTLYTLTFYGSMTHNATGGTGDGATAYADTGIPSSLFANNGGIGAYVVSGGDTTFRVLIGVRKVGTPIYNFRLTHQSGKFQTIHADATGANGTINAVGFGFSQRIASNDLKLYTTNETITSTGEATLPATFTNNLFAWATNDGGTAGSFSNHTISFLIFSNVLTLNEVTTLRTTVNALQIALGRA